MLRLIDRDLGQAEQAILDQLQAKVNAKPDFAKKAKEVDTLWGTKGGVKGRKAFEQIRLLLESMCVGVKACNYCEGNEANDIEHIFPKSFFPEFAFVWKNYLLACKQCNSGYKLDLCYVMDDTGKVYATTRGKAPKYKKITMVNPRIEDPRDFFWLNIKVWKFEIHEGLSLADQNKAAKTLEILALNERDYLLAGRRASAVEYFDKMERLRLILGARTVKKVKEVLSPYQDIVDDTLPLAVIKKEFKESVKQHIQKLLHPSVWESIKTIESKENPQWKTIFKRIPEALQW